MICVVFFGVEIIKEIPIVNDVVVHELVIQIYVVCLDYPWELNLKSRKKVFKVKDLG